MRIHLAILMTVSVATSARADFKIQSGPKQVPLVELYTSEGCSSCPVADAWLSNLKDDPQLWKDFVPVAFHVDYWDRLGWKDRFARSAFTSRQNDYARAWKAENVYTPEFALGGTEWLGWRGQTQPPISRRPNTGRLAAQSSDLQTVTVTFTPSGSEHPPLVARAAVLGFGQSSAVARGENKGQTLHHDFVVLSYQSTPLESIDRKTLSGTIELGDVLKGSLRLALAVWIERKGDPRPLQSAGGWWSEK